MKTAVHFNIAEPCHEDWQQMTPHEQGRYCGSCQKTVVDFSVMTDQEVLAFMSRTTSMVCGRLANDQLNRPMVERTARPAFSFRYFWSALVSGFLLIGQGAGAQEKEIPRLALDTEWRERLKTALRLRLHKQSPPIGGVVLDSRTRQPVAHASITLPGVGTIAAANENGVFTVTDLAIVDTVVVEISAVGYDTKIYQLQAGQPIPGEWVLDPTSAQMEAVKIIGYGGRRGCGTTGSLSMVQSVSLLEQVERKMVNLWPGKSSVTVYPNPANTGGNVKVELNIKTTGDYKLELLDASGRLVHVQGLQVMQPMKVVNLSTQSSWSRGIYWMRVTGLVDKKVYHAKLVLQ